MRAPLEGIKVESPAGNDMCQWEPSFENA